MSDQIETSPTLSRLTEEGLAIQELLLQEDLNLEDEQALRQALDHIHGEWLAKVANIRDLVLDWKYRSANLKAEADRLYALHKALDTRIEYLKRYTLQHMIEAGEEKGYTFDGGLGEIKVAKSPPSIEVINESEIPAVYQRIVTTTTPNKKAMLDAFRDNPGTQIPGVHHVTDKKRLVIK